jgi:hypothetical protein
MFKTPIAVAGFLVGVGLTIGLLLTPHMLPWSSWFGVGWRWPWLLIAGAVGVALLVLGLTLWVAGRIIDGANSWREARVILGALLIAFVANALFCLLVELFALGGGMRALVAVLGVPVIYGNLVAVLGKTSLKEAMAGIVTGALTTMGAGFITAALIRGW